MTEQAVHNGGKEKVLITGASGFLGSHLITSALEKGLDVYAAVRKSSDVRHLKNLPISWSYLDYEDPAALQKELAEKRFNYIIHAAGVTKAVKQEDFNHINASYAVNLAKAIDLSEGYFKKMVFISSLAAIGPLNDNSALITEETSPRPVTAYGRSKLLAEQQLSALPVPLTILRPTAVYGPRDKEIFVMVKALTKGLDAYIGRISQQLSFVHGKDMGDIAVQSLFIDAPGKAYNISDGNHYNKYQFADIINTLLNKKAFRVHLPVGMVKALAFLLETVNGMLKRPTMISREKLRELAAVNWGCDISKARSELHFNPQFDLQRGLEDSISWYQKNKWI